MQAVQFEIRAGVAVITLNRPERGTAIDLGAFDLLHACLHRCWHDAGRRLAADPRHAYGTTKRLIAAALPGLESQLALESLAIAKQRISDAAAAARTEDDNRFDNCG